MRSSYGDVCECPIHTTDAITDKCPIHSVFAEGNGDRISREAEDKPGGSF